jgi:regulator of replication initiation timing
MFGIIGAKTVHINIVKGAEIKALESELQALNIERDLLQVEVDRLRSVARIEKAALAMGMEKPEETIYIAEDLIPLEKAAGVDQTQEIAVTPSESETNSVVDKIFHVFTSFFGSTQR